MRYGIWVADCLHTLSRSSSPDHLTLLAWARLQRTAEESLEAVELEDRSIIMLGGRTRLMERSIVQIILWKDLTPPDLVKSKYTITQYQDGANRTKLL